MVRVVKEKSFKTRLSDIALSPFILPVLTFAFVMVTLPVIYLMAQHEQDIRQNAATIATNSVVINTEDVSYQSATEEVLTSNTITVSGLTIGLIVITIISIIVIAYRRKFSSY